LPGETISASIGQGFVTVTPLQMASMMATVANDGVNYRPRLVQAVMDRATGNLQELPAVPRGKINAKPETFRIIKDALADVVTKGTATRAKSSIVTIGGKTGTAQVAALRPGPEEDIPKKFRDHAWFVAFAPVQSPKIAVVVLAEHMGHGGATAAPLAKEVIEAYMQLPSQSPVVTSGLPAVSRHDEGSFTES
ncbi:MAG: penicillin-binding transpeptidase domain-containing protein, partial [Nitrospira sp.]|nr:penicillin-binding transpeptidase domain-containing protein [Nitrospira sp.]